MEKAGRHRIYTVSIVIQWCDDNDNLAEIISRSLQLNLASLGPRQSGVQPSNFKRPAQKKRVRAPAPPPRLLPTDRIVLDALRARVPQGKKVTTAVSTRELMLECLISRRQVQICLRRLGEKGIITRLTEGVSLGSQKGYRYQIS